MPFDADDLAAFLDPDMPGYVVAEIDGRSVGGLLRRSSGLRDGLLLQEPPTFTSLVDHLADVLPGDVLTVGGRPYRVTELRPGSEGLAILDLSHPPA